MAACRYGDPTCPCQDGGTCHYEPQGKGQEKTLPMLVRPEFVRQAIAQASAKGYTRGQKDMRDAIWRGLSVLGASMRWVNAVRTLPMIEEKDNG